MEITVVEVELKPDDKRLGRRTKGGYEWPEVDINGRKYRRENIVTKHVGNDRFVIIPQGRNHRYEVTVAEAPEASHKGTSAASAPPPAPAAPLKNKDKSGDGEDDK